VSDLVAPSSFVARLTADAPTAALLQDAFAQACDEERLAVAIAVESDERWSVAVHFPERPDASQLRARIASLAGHAVAAELTIEELAPADWVRTSLEGLKPVHAGRFVVHGAHYRGRVAFNITTIQIDAALAFGTGHHGSTLGCLLALDRIRKRAFCRPKTSGNAGCARRRRRNAAVLDIGTGTGVLAIAAAKSLRQEVLAGDIDRRAVIIARENARINGVASLIQVAHASGVAQPVFRERSPYLLVLANILLEPLQKLATPIARLLAPGGVVVLSGLLKVQAESAFASFRARGLVLVQRLTLGGWTTLVLVRPHHGRSKIARMPPSP
jgi:ribosomal protein L11 methyltransferase